MRVQGLPLWLSLWGGGGVHRVQAVRSCSLSLGVFRPFALPLSLSCFACRVACEYGFISHFKGVFSAFWGADVCLYGFGALRGLWGFCVRERLGGFGACCVFRLSFSSLFLSCPAFVLLLSCFPAWLLLLVLSCFLGFVGLAVGFLSLSDYTQKERALRVGASSLVLLWLRWLLSCHYNFAGFNSILHACHIVHWNIVPIPSVTVVIEANKCKI